MKPCHERVAPFVETIPGALTFLMGEFKKLIAERAAVDHERVVAHEEIAALSSQVAQLQAREAALVQDLRLLEYALEQERERVGAAGTYRRPGCHVSVQAALPLHAVPPTPPAPASPVHGRHDPHSQRTENAALEGLHREREGSKSPRMGHTPGKKRRPQPLAIAGDDQMRATLAEDAEAPAAMPVPILPPSQAPHPHSRPFPQPKPKPKPQPTGGPRQPSPPPEHPMAKAPLRFPIEQAADEGRRPSPPLAPDVSQYLLMSPEPKTGPWGLEAPSPNQPQEAAPQKVSNIERPVSNDSELDPLDAESPSGERRGSQPVPLFSELLGMTDFDEYSPKFGSVGSVLHLSNREDSSSSEADTPLEGGPMDTGSLLPQPKSGTVWRSNLCLHSHFDAVRCLAWHPINAYIVTGSDDHTLRLWNLTGWLKAKPEIVVRTDVTPMCIYRGHTGPVTECAMLNDNMVSASCDGTVKVWPLSARDAPRQCLELRGHSDAVWSVDPHPIETRAISAAADGRMALWDWAAKDPLRQTYSLLGADIPTCARWERTGLTSAIVAHRMGTIAVFDLETSAVISRFDGLQTGDSSPAVPLTGPRRYYRLSPPGLDVQINKVATHPTTRTCFTAHENGLVKWWDLGAGKLIHSMACQEQAVADIAVHPGASLLASTGHGSASIRLWDLSKRCLVEDISLHVSKGEETGLCVQWHGSKPLFAAGGADSTVQVLRMR